MMLLSPSLQRVVAASRRRSLSAVANADQSLFLPTRHSRHAPPATCVDDAPLAALTQEVLQSGPGSLFTYKRSHGDDAWSAEEIDGTVQKVEYLIRGHAARIPGTLGNQVYGLETPGQDPSFHLTDMDRLMRRIRKEGEDYVKLRVEMNAQLTRAEDQEKEDADGFDFDDDMKEAEFVDETDNEQNSESLQGSDTAGASPGVTVAMVDTYFDAMAVSPSGSCPPAELSDLLLQTVQRYHADGGQESNTNVHTTPTILTFNAIFRALSTNMNLSDEATRDEALQLAIGMYDSMRHIVDRNSATYTYLLGLMEQCLPASISRGNMVHGIWMQAVQEAVVDVNVMEALRTVQSSTPSEKHVLWVQEHLPSNVNDLPLRSRRNAKRRRYQRKDATY